MILLKGLDLELCVRMFIANDKLTIIVYKIVYYYGHN